jgi:hypothetical protein
MSHLQTSIGRVLSFPSLVQLATTTDSHDGARSWIQLARVGSFQSSRYGRFEIATDDLRMMAQNFRPATTPIDYDHLSNEPKRPGDGIAAGWLQQVELRDGGATLWGLVAWTPDAAKYIANGEYRFISPSFVKDARDAFGNELGTKLIAAALTNMPFLPSMAAVTLADEEVFGAFALSVPAGAAPATRAISLAELGQRVAFNPDSEHTPELTDDERRQTFVVKSTIGAGDDQFVRLAALDGLEFGWFRVSQLVPAPAATPEVTQENTAMNDRLTGVIEARAVAFAERVRALSRDRPARDAISLATVQDTEGAEAYRLAGIGAKVVQEELARGAVSLSVVKGESFDALAMRYAVERGISLRAAIHEVGKARPDLALARE